MCHAGPDRGFRKRVIPVPFLRKRRSSTFLAEEEASSCGGGQGLSFHLWRGGKVDVLTIIPSRHGRSRPKILQEKRKTVFILACLE